MDSVADLPAVIADPQAHAANPTPPSSSNGAHPPYSEMIVAAIAALQDKDGSSRQAIAKYIEKEYANLPPTHSSLLTHHLKRMKNEGELMMVKHSYMLPPPRSVPFQLPTPTMDHHITDYSVTDTFACSKAENSAVQPRRKPGRPPKPRQDFGFQAQAQLPDGQPAAAYQPQFQHQLHLGQDLRSHYAAEPIFVSLGLADDGVAPTLPSETALVSAKRGRGRPPKAAAAARSVVTTSGGDGASSGGSGSGSGSEVEAGKRVPRRKAGRPKLMSITMVNGGGPKRTSGRPKRIGGPVTVPLSGNVMRPRGRPKRSQNISVNTGDGGSGSVSRGRGRPPKSSGGANKIRKLTSKPFGWSNKVESGTAVLVTDPHQLVAFQELKFKYEHLQSKAKEVLSVVRPYINSDYAVFGALEELETLVADAPSSSNV
ncbi:hypothetical protein L6452_15130 [Arctium lappa]|uniref:Uncharacterized protein n=1 Tax=Arctium lappa TaxID=4217 RepID=A0ACB9CMR2_ARCLA|nr:hypothetical protein L6452_15130 [Arctium lappa]